MLVHPPAPPCPDQSRCLGHRPAAACVLGWLFFFKSPVLPWVLGSASTAVFHFFKTGLFKHTTGASLHLAGTEQARGGAGAQQGGDARCPSSHLSPPCSGHTPPTSRLHSCSEEQGGSSQQTPWESQRGITVQPVWSPGTLTAGPRVLVCAQHPIGSSTRHGPTVLREPRDTPPRPGDRLVPGAQGLPRGPSCTFLVRGFQGPGQPGAGVLGEREAAWPHQGRRGQCWTGPESSRFS